MVEMNLESIVFDNPLLINISSIGERQFVGGASNLTTFPSHSLSPLKASSKFRIGSGFNPVGFAFSDISAARHNCLAARIDTPEKLERKKTVIRLSLASRNIRCNCPNSIP